MPQQAAAMLTCLALPISHFWVNACPLSVAALSCVVCAVQLNRTPLYEACERGHAEVVKELLLNRANKDTATTNVRAESRGRQGA